MDDTQTLVTDIPDNEPETIEQPPLFETPPPPPEATWPLPVVPKEPKPQRHLTILHVIAAFIAGGVLVGAGFGLGVDKREANTNTIALPQTSDSAGGRPVDVTGEPVAQVARAVLPSTVEIETTDGLGSGVVYDNAGHILTAAHVVEGANDVTVRIADGERVKGSVVGRDTGRDVAVVKVDKTGLPPARLARNVPVVVGQLAVALGSPFGLDETVTSGVVSAVGRVIPSSDTAVETIQTDAAVNPGNSGGPLADRQGRIIGINVAKAEAGGVAFAIPIDVAMTAADRIVAGQGAAPVAFVGIRGTDPTSGPGGAQIVSVESNSPASKAGLKVGDVVTAVDGNAISSMAEFAGEIQRHAPGDNITLTVLRGGNTSTITVTLGSRS